MGFAIATLLAERGAHVWINDVDADAAHGAADRLGPAARSAAFDVTDREAVFAMVQHITEATGGPDVLVNNAGVLAPTPLAEISEAEWRRTLDVNLNGAFFCTQAVIGPMRAAGWGRIVNLASTAGKTVSTLGGAHYTTSKSGLLGLTRAAAKELAGDGITVNAVCPGLIDTEMARENADAEALAAFASSFPIPRLGQPREVAELVCFLASDRGAYITGAALDINGGDLMV